LPKQYARIGRAIEARGNSAARGYDQQWKRFRERFLREYPFCAGSREGYSGQQPDAKSNHCALLVLATQVHHSKKIKDFPELRLDERVCMPQCDSCHSARTARGE
jgi:hypothetical protein